MDNKNTLIGTVLIGILLVFFVYYQQSQLEQENAAKPPKSQLASKQSPRPSSTAAITAEPSSAAPAIEDSAAAPLVSGPFGPEAAGKEQLLVVETPLIKATFTNKGGRLKSLELRQFKTWRKDPLMLLDEKSFDLNYQFAIENNRVINTNDYFFEADQSSLKLEEGQKGSVSFRLKASNGGYITQTYSFSANSYEIDYLLGFKGLQGVIPESNTFIAASWNQTMKVQEKDLPTERRYSGLYFAYKDQDAEHLDLTKSEEQNFSGNMDWISFKQQFFNLSWFSEGNFKSGVIKSFHKDEDQGYVKKYSASIILPFKGGEKEYKMKWFAGPNKYDLLSKAGKGFEDIIQLGPDFALFSWFALINKWFIIPIFNLFERINMNYGIIILMLTLILKLVLTPLTFTSYKSMAAMKVLKPELDELKEKYGDDQQKMGAEQMKLYQRAGVSPFGGCLPMLLQMPILIAMYYFFPSSIELRQQPFLWADDLSTYDAIVTFSSALPLIGQHISLFTILMTLTSLIQAYMNAGMSVQSDQPGMKYMPYIFPVMLMFLFNSFPAALTYYYLLQNVLGSGQQWFIQKFYLNEEKLRKQIEENKKKPVKKSAFQQRLEDMSKQAEQRNRKK